MGIMHGMQEHLLQQDPPLHGGFVGTPLSGAFVLI